MCDNYIILKTCINTLTFPFEFKIDAVTGKKLYLFVIKHWIQIVMKFSW